MYSPQHGYDGLSRITVETLKCVKCDNPITKSIQLCAQCKQPWHPSCAYGRRRHSQVHDSWRCGRCAFPDDTEGASACMRSPSPPPPQEGDGTPCATPSAEEMNGKITNLEEEIRRLKFEQGRSKRSNHGITDEIRKLKVTMQCMLQLRYSFDIQLQGVQLMAGENPAQLVVRVAKLLGVSMEETDLVRCARLPYSNPRYNPYIIATFRMDRAYLRSALLRARWATPITNQKLIENGDVQRVYVNERLTRYFNKLLCFTKEVARENGFTLAPIYWNCKILVQRFDSREPPIEVQSFYDLHKIKPSIDHNRIRQYIQEHVPFMQDDLPPNNDIQRSIIQRLNGRPAYVAK